MPPRTSRSLSARLLRRLLAVTGAAVALTAVTAAPVPAAAVTRPSVHVGVSVPGGPWSAAQVDAYDRVAGKRPSLLMWFADFTTPFPADGVTRARARGAVPVITWEPVGGPGSRPGAYSLARIAAGAHDTYLRTWARAAKRDGRTVIVRLAPEMNGNWVPWGPGVDGNTPAQYVAAWRHVVALFRAEGATNVRWVWCPNVPYPGSIPLARFFPGDAWTHWVGVDGYNWGRVRPDTRWQSFDQVFGPALRQLDTLSNRPVMLGEVGSTEVGGSKAAWTTDFFAQLRRHPEVRAFVWFNHAKETDWRVQSSPAAARAYRAGVADPRYHRGVR